MESYLVCCNGCIVSYDVFFMIFIFLYQAFVIWLAIKNAKWSNTKDEWKIKHWLNGLIHLAVSGLIGYFFGWNLAFSNLIFTRIVFDTTMNIRRDLSLGYVSPDPESKLDQAEKWIVLKLAGKNPTENKIEWVAIWFRIFLLGLACFFMFLKL